MASPEKYSLCEDKYAFSREMWLRQISLCRRHIFLFGIAKHFSFASANYLTFLINRNANIIKNNPYTNIQLYPIKSNNSPRSGGDTILAIDENK